MSVRHLGENSVAFILAFKQDILYFVTRLLFFSWSKKLLFVDQIYNLIIIPLSCFCFVQKQSIVPADETPVFADWAAGITPETPDRSTVEKYILNMVDVSSLHLFHNARKNI